LREKQEVVRKDDILGSQKPSKENFSRKREWPIDCQIILRGQVRFKQRHDY